MFRITIQMKWFGAFCRASNSNLVLDHEHHKYHCYQRTFGFAHGNGKVETFCRISFLKINAVDIVLYMRVVNIIDTLSYIHTDTHTHTHRIHRWKKQEAPNTGLSRRMRKNDNVNKLKQKLGQAQSTRGSCMRQNA